MHNKRFEVLDSFRGIAAFCVVILHMRFIGTITELDFFRGSYLFVEFFFVLSGFVIAHAYAFRENSFIDFVTKRSLRLMPLHLFMLLVFVLFEFGKLIMENYGFNFNVSPFTNGNSIQGIVPNILLLQAWFPSSKFIGWNGPSWTISIEYYMYIIFFITLRVKRYKYLVWFIISIVSFYFLFNGSEVLALRGLSCFFAGALVYILYLYTKKYISKCKNPLFTFFEIFVSILLIILISTKNINNISSLITFHFMFTIYVFSFERGIISSFLNNNNLTKALGKFSFSIYMTHYAVLFIMTSVISILEKILKREFIVNNNGFECIDLGNIFFNNLVFIFVLVIVMFVSVIANKYIEINGEKYGKKILINCNKTKLLNNKPVTY